MNSKIVVSLGFFYLLRSKEEQTPLTEDSAIHALATHGGNCTLKTGKNTPAATHYVVGRTLVKVFLERSMAVITSSKLFLIRT